MGHRYSVFADIPASSPGLIAALSPEDSHHIRTVLRFKSGDLLRVINRSSGQRFEAQIEALEPVVSVRLLREERTSLPAPRIRALILSASKGKHNDEVCEKACELGIDHFILFQAERSAVKLEGTNRLDRLRRIAESSARQSMKERVPEVHAAASLASLLDTIRAVSEPSDRLLFGSLQPGARMIRELLPPAGKVSLLIGPEADLSGAEESALKDFGFEPISLGPYALRVETAAVTAVAMIYGAWGYCEPKGPEGDPV